MKSIYFFIVITALFMTSCSEEVLTPLTQADRISVEKSIITNFNFIHFPLQLTGEGEIKLIGNNWIFKNIGVIESFSSSDTLAAGIMHHYLSGCLNALTGEGALHGYWTITPTANVGGVWEGNYNGYRFKTPGSDTLYSLPLKATGQGKGGVINGMQIQVTTVMTAWGTPPAGWYGSGEGYYKSH